MTTTGVWTIEVGDEASFKHLDSKSAVFPALEEIIAADSDGRVCVDEDVGENSWFSRTILRLNPRIQAMRFAIEWSGEICSLIFFDDAVSEYRAISSDPSRELDGETRLKVSHGQEAPHPLDECLSLSEGLRAIRDFLDSGSRPSWLDYRYVK
ncbi:MAG: hypothetical protein AAF591_07775 [Verrucomicrobiota bacterium]